MADDHFVVFDVDAGTDDAWAMLMLIKAETVFNLFKILAITTVVGNTYVGNTTENAIRILESVDRLDIPVYKGSSQPLMPMESTESFFYGEDGFGDVLPSNPSVLEQIPKDHAVNAMYDLASKYPNKVSFIMAGPLTNLATCITMHDDFLEKVKDIWIFGGNLYDYRNTSDSPEFNLISDTVATNILLRNVEAPVYIVPIEPCMDVNANGFDLEFRFNNIGAVDTPSINLLNKVEKAIFVPKGNWHLYDPYLAAAFVFGDEVVVRKQGYHGKMDVCGKSAGELMLDQIGGENVFMIQEFNADKYKRIIAWTAGVPNVEIANASYVAV